MASVKEILTLARDLLAKGWTKGALYENVNGVERYCALGAIDHATARLYKVPTMFILGDPEAAARDHIAVHEVAKAIVRIDPARLPIPSSVAIFNDQPQRKHEEVLAVFDAAIAAQP